MNHSDFTTRIITSTDEFLGCSAQWNELAGTRVFHRWEWMFSWWEAFRQEGDLAILVVIDQFERWLGIAPWYKTKSTGRGNVLRQLASGTACSDYVSLAIRPGYDQIVAAEITKALVEQMRQGGPLSDIDLLELEGHTADDNQVQQLTESAEREYGKSESCEFAGTWRAALPNTWVEYEARLHKSFRRKTKKASKRLDSPEFEPMVHWAPEAMVEYWPVFVDLHQRRRQSLQQPGCFADKRFEQFLRSATLRLSEHALAQINIVSHQGKPLTANLEFFAGDSIFMYQTGFDPDHIDLEPGHITFTWAIKRSIEREFRWFDFLRGDEPYKSRWKAQRMPLFKTKIVPRRLSSVLRNGLVTAGHQVKGWTKSIIGSST